jgi:glycosyltransferase involved in cell wall biosynthesis
VHLNPHLLDARTAIVHDWFQGYHGSERVVDVMRAGLFAPGNEPDIFTFYAARELLPSELAERIIHQSRLAQLPLLRQSTHGPGRWRYLLPLIPLYFRSLDLDAYRLVISSSHSFAFHVRPPEAVTHVCYCHTPMYYAWMPRSEGDQARGVPGRLLDASRGTLRRVDRRAAQGPDHFVANSETVRRRIAAFYGRDAKVIHPPVDIEDFDPTVEKEPGTFLWVQRLVPHKRPEIVAEAFRGLPYRLTMVGVGMLEETLRRTLPPNVELLPWLSRHELAERYSRAAAFIHVGEEDFGISMVEALAAGTPLIALRAGGALDIVRENVDGILLPTATVSEIRRAVRHVAEREWDPAELAARARGFSRQAFLERFNSYLAEIGVE